MNPIISTDGSIYVREESFKGYMEMGQLTETTDAEWDAESSSCFPTLPAVKGCGDSEQNEEYDRCC
jgi:hypothetical protein